MKMSQLFSQTIREKPSLSDVTSHQLLIRAGFIHLVKSGIFSYLPLAKRSLAKIENIIQEEINAIGGQEITVPNIQPAEFLIESGRWSKTRTKMGQLQGSSSHEIVHPITNEEIVAELVKIEIRSYRQLPQLLYHIQIRWQDEPHPRPGLLNSKELKMMTSYSLDAEWEGLDTQYQSHQNAFKNIYKRCHLPVILSKSDIGITGGKLAQEYVYPSPIGENTILICANCGYSANSQIAKAKKIPINNESQRKIKKVFTPNCKTIDGLAEYLSIPTHKTAKALFIIATILNGIEKHEQFVIAIVRGDMEVNETKLLTELNALDIRPAIESEIRAVGAIPGYASPFGLNNVFTIVDELIPLSSNLVSGANIEEYHLLNVNFGRDYSADIIADITVAHDKDFCTECNHPLQAKRAVEVGKLFKLGTHFSESMGCNFLDRQAQIQPIIFGSFEIGTERLLTCIAEEHHDEHGLIWPITVSPYLIHLISLPWKSSAPSEIGLKMADELYQRFQEAQIECLYDDREDSPGVKFNDADLIGNPIRLTISERSIKNGGIEFKRRDLPEKIIISYENIIPAIHEEITHLEPK